VIVLFSIKVNSLAEYFNNLLLHQNKIFLFFLILKCIN